VIIAERFLAKFTHAFISVGIRVRDDLLAVKIGNPKKFTVINPGLEIKVGKSREFIRSELGIPTSTFVICWLGRLVQIKRPDRLLEIAQEVRKLNSDALFLCVGGGPMLNDIQERAIKSRLPIIFTGWRNDVGDLLNSADLLLLTSDNEGTPVAIIQSQMLGIPAISTDVGSVKEVLVDGKSGVATKYDPNVFAETIVKFAQDYNHLNSFREAAIAYSDAFSIQSLVNRHENLYQSLYKANQSNS
jgi:glycosyltransferase involved in cell wall biosynthesis